MLGCCEKLELEQRSKVLVKTLQEDLVLVLMHYRDFDDLQPLILVTDPLQKLYGLPDC